MFVMLQSTEDLFIIFLKYNHLPVSLTFVSTLPLIKNYMHGLCQRAIKIRHVLERQRICLLSLSNTIIFQCRYHSFQLYVGPSKPTSTSSPSGLHLTTKYLPC